MNQTMEAFMLDKNGGIIYNDIICAFNNAVNNPDNQHNGGGINWDFVSADLCIELGGIYSFDYLDEILELLVDDYFDRDGG